ncbi:hypothetical protein CHS0354_038237 [Potamilus streckersoni]|uniref:NudC domain-containing protein 1 n=1 Tax=Potamilus streckersoni TaxID=2493646 RepID=A0AAE0T0Q8_9BIVA|nr:hypothetical protein CHS0354_038237 [Potamilus streckersoni]
MAELNDLKVRRDLLDPHFDGYKLSLDKLPLYNCRVESGVATTSLTDEQYSYHHAKIFGVHNNLISDPWKSNDCYYIDNSWNVRSLIATDTSVSVGQDLFTIPDFSIQRQVKGHYNANLLFVAIDLVVLADGAGKVYLLYTGDRNKTTSKWKVLSSQSVFEEDKPCMLVDAVEHVSNESHRVETLLVHVKETTIVEKEKYHSEFLTVLEWLTFESGSRETWSLERTRRLVSRRPYHYASLDRMVPSLVIAGEADMEFVYDSVKPVTKEEEKETYQNDLPEYTWNQTTEDIRVQFTVPKDVKKANIYLSLTSELIEFGIKNSTVLLKGHLHSKVDPEGSTWTISSQRVELYLSKEDQSMWPEIVKDDTRGELVMDPDQVAKIHDRLANLTSEQWNPNTLEDQKAPYNAQQLEECDMYPDDNFVLERLDGDLHKITHKTNLGSHQWLFNAILDHKKMPCFCLRHDVDGLLWQPANDPKEGELPWQHESTFNAFGYVQASKQQKKFTSCPPDYSYTVISDCVRHSYIYWQPSPISSLLRNRKTGKEVPTVAKQQVVSLDSAEDIVGIQAFNEKLFVLTENVVYMIKMNE